jgi:hypothetical protein
MRLQAALVPASLAYAEPPPLSLALIAGIGHERQHATGACANVRRELRFEMINVDADPYPPTWRDPAVCLAVYNPPR